MFDAVPELRSQRTRRIVGTVMESDSVAHVVVRVHTRWSDPPPPVPRDAESLAVLTLRRGAGGWRPMLTGGLTDADVDLINAVQ